MRKVNLERKIDLALNEAICCFNFCKPEDIKDSIIYPETSLLLIRYHLERVISFLCMLDDWVVEEKSTYYCLSEIERNVNNFLEERKRKQNENGNK